MNRRAGQRASDRLTLCGRAASGSPRQRRAGQRASDRLTLEAELARAIQQAARRPARQ